MGESVIQVEKLWKEYRLGVINHHTLARDLQSWWARIRRKEDPNSLVGSAPSSSSASRSARQERFVALRDVSLEVKRGDVVGIIGRNGAGKSTLLKILSQVTAPTRGEVRLRGRMASLLEVGTGFHPELTGRENIFLNGAILGMSKADIRSRLDEMVAFAEVEKFIDTPVKRYSSGMYVRLAFAVAAHLEPEILVVDEVLAVGDAQFQKKCLGKMQEVGKEGRTVLFVSHNMAAAQQLCRRGILLAQGGIAMDDDMEQVISRYLRHGNGVSPRSEWLEERDGPLSNQYFSLKRIAIADVSGAALAMPVRNDEDFYLTVEFDLKKRDEAFQIGFALYDEENALLFWSFNTDSAESGWPFLAVGRNVLRTRLQKNLLNEGSYKIALLAACYHREWLLKPEEDNPFVTLEIRDGLSQSPYWYGKRRGVLAPVLSWHSATKG